MGILQARILEWVAIPFYRGSSQPMDFNPGLLDCRQILYCPSHWGRLTSAVRFPSNTTDSYQPTEAGLQDSSSPQSSDFWENCRHAAGREAGQGGWLSGPWGYAYLMRMMTEGV